MNDMTLEEIARTVYFAIEKRWNVDIALMNLDVVDLPSGPKHIVEIETVEGTSYRIDIQEE